MVNTSPHFWNKVAFVNYWLQAFIPICNVQRQYAESDNAANRSQVIARLDRRMEDNFDGVCDKLANEFFITGQLWFDYFSPKELGRCSFGCAVSAQHHRDFQLCSKFRSLFQDHFRTSLCWLYWSTNGLDMSECETMTSLYWFFQLVKARSFAGWEWMEQVGKQ